MPTAFSRDTPAYHRTETPIPTPTGIPTMIPMATVTPESFCNSVPVWDLPSVSSNGKYSLEVTPSPYEADPKHPTKIIVRQTTNPTWISEFYPLDQRNVPPSFQVGFTANDTILASWGCGTYCSVSVLYAPNGQILRNDFQFFEISPARNIAVDYPAWELPVSGDIRIIDLNTGQILKTEHYSSIYSTCCATWDDLSVVLHHSCKNQTSEDLTIMLSNR
jgi:hypothetical protein